MLANGRRRIPPFIAGKRSCPSLAMADLESLAAEGCAAYRLQTAEGDLEGIEGWGNG